MTESKKPFIVRSRFTEMTPDDASRRSTILSDLTEEDFQRVTGGTNWHWTEIGSGSWDPSSGRDYPPIRKDPGSS